MSGSARVLALDVGTSSVRATVVGESGGVEHVETEVLLPSSPAPGFVEIDAAAMADAVLRVAGAAIERCGTVAAVGIANQRLSTILWDRATSRPVAPGIGWQDVRTAGMCLALKDKGIDLAPNQSATKLAMLLDFVDPGRERDLCFGTVETWVAWTLSGGAVHATDWTNAHMTGLVSMDQPEGRGWDLGRCEQLAIPSSVLPGIVDSCAVTGTASRLPGSPPIAAMAGDQQASLVGQGGVLAGAAKATFGTGGMLDCNLGGRRPDFERRGPSGCFPVVTSSRKGELSWGVEAVMLSAGACVEWLRDDLGVIESAGATEAVAASVPDAGGVFFVPALFGLGTPVWDFGARGAFVGMTRGTSQAELVRAVLEGIAHSGADLLEAAERDAGIEIRALSVDGGMSANRTFLQALADATGRRIDVSPVLEATGVGACFLAGVATGIWPDLSATAALVRPRESLQPRRRLDRDAWREARRRSERAVPELSALDF